MIVKTSSVDVTTASSPMRLFVAEPAQSSGTFPGLVLWTDIFGLTPATERAVVRFASYGFIVAVPEFYHRTEPIGTGIPFEDRDHAMMAASATRTPDFDADTRTTIDFLKAQPRVRSGAIGTTGFCIGGHLAVRAALQPEIVATVAFYPTGLHDDSLGGSTGVDTLARASKGAISGPIALAFGASDPHIPLAGITKIQTAFAGSKTPYLIAMYDGEHAFMRDEGPRYNPSESDRAYADAIAFFRDAFARVDG